MDQTAFGALSDDIHIERRQVVHPLYRNMRLVVRLKVNAVVEAFGKRQEGYYGDEAFVTEESDYVYPQRCMAERSCWCELCEDPR